MYIIAKKKDYYDGVVGTMGIDKTIVYNRETEIIDDDTKFPKPFHINKPYNGKWVSHFQNLSHYGLQKNSKYEIFGSFIVGFCGKLYTGWKFYREIMISKTSYIETFITYDREFIKNNIQKSTWSYKLMDDLDYVDTYNSMDVFRNLKVPVFIYDGDYNRTSIDKRWPRHKVVFIINPILSDYEFYKIFDTFAAFQELSMFIGGVLGSGEKNIVEVEDKYKITQHGFDKFSFRRSKANGKKRPVSNR